MIRLVDVAVHVPVQAGGSAARERAILQDIGLDLTERRIAVVGANGSGKSTLLRLLNGLVEPTRGQVLVDGLDTRREGAAVRRRVGFVFTEPLAQLVMSTPVEDVELSLRRTMSDRRARRAEAMARLAAAGLEPLATQSIYDLSGGERQLVALTSVLATGPAILVADEPTTLLDLRNREVVRRALMALPQQVVYATHDLDFAADAERVLVVDAGRVVHDGPPQEAIAAYRALVGTP
ncbi:MAG: energy-coupling factor ABC transporter ATP-binding protein [Dermatophilaceae bacterium]